MEPDGTIVSIIPIAGFLSAVAVAHCLVPLSKRGAFYARVTACWASLNDDLAHFCSIATCSAGETPPHRTPQVRTFNVHFGKNPSKHNGICHTCRKIQQMNPYQLSYAISLLKKMGAKKGV